MHTQTISPGFSTRHIFAILLTSRVNLQLYPWNFRMSASTPFYKSKYFFLTVGTAISLGLLWWVMRDMIGDPVAMRQIGVAFRTADYRSLPVIWAVLFIFYWLKAWRWRLLLAPVGQFRVMKDLFPPIMIGFGLNNVLPARVGEVVRCAVFAKKEKVPFAVSLSSVVLERVLDAIAVLFFVGIGLLFTKDFPEELQTKAYIVAAAAVVCVLGGIAYMVWTKPFVNLVEGILNRIPFLPKSLTDKICDMLETGADGLSSMKNPRLLMVISAISIVKWAFNGTLILLALWSFDVEVDITVAMLVLGAIAFGVVMPSSPGYFGVIQICFTSVLLIFVNDKETLFAASIYYHLAQWVPVTIIGLIYFAKSGMDLKAIEEAEEKAQKLAAESHSQETDGTDESNGTSSTTTAQLDSPATATATATMAE